MNLQKQTGFVLLTSMMFLLALSLLGVMALRGSLFEERMAANEQDRALAREYAELALRDAERDILGLRFDGAFCANTTTPCKKLRPADTRPKDATEAGNFWVASNLAIGDVGDESGGKDSSAEAQGIFIASSATACGKPVWSGANWEDGVLRTCNGTISDPVPTIPYGTFTDAPFFGPDGVTAPQGIPRPRYIIEMFRADDLGITPTSNKLFFRITVVGFGRTTGPTGRTSVTLQSVFSPL